MPGGEPTFRWRDKGCPCEAASTPKEAAVTTAPCSQQLPSSSLRPAQVPVPGPHSDQRDHSSCPGSSPSGGISDKEHAESNRRKQTAPARGSALVICAPGLCATMAAWGRGLYSPHVCTQRSTWAPEEPAVCLGEVDGVNQPTLSPKANRQARPSASNTAA